jgi:hypothetical protein
VTVPLGVELRCSVNRGPFWVKSGNAHNEPMMSAFHPITTEQRTQFYVRFVPKAVMPLRRIVELLYPGS